GPWPNIVAIQDARRRGGYPSEGNAMFAASTFDLLAHPAVSYRDADLPVAVVGRGQFLKSDNGNAVTGVGPFGIIVHEHHIGVLLSGVAEPGGDQWQNFTTETTGAIDCVA